MALLRHLNVCSAREAARLPNSSKHARSERSFFFATSRAQRERVHTEDGRTAACCACQKEQSKLDTLSRRYNCRIHVRAPHEAAPIVLREQAAQAARLPDLRARVTTGGGR